MTARIAISVGNDFRFLATMEDAVAPATCTAFRRLLPYTQRLVHCRWSGEGCWIPLGTFELGVGPENSTSTPRPGELLWYPGSGPSGARRGARTRAAVRLGGLRVPCARAHGGARPYACCLRCARAQAHGLSRMVDAA